VLHLCDERCENHRVQKLFRKNHTIKTKTGNHILQNLSWETSIAQYSTVHYKTGMHTVINCQSRKLITDYKVSVGKQHSAKLGKSNSTR
jgi:hypothetical protein